MGKIGDVAAVIRAAGIESTAEMSRRSGVQIGTLYNWFKGDKRRVFDLVLLGLVAEEVVNDNKTTRE